MVNQLENLGLKGQSSSKFLEYFFYLFNILSYILGPRATHYLEPPSGTNQKKQNRKQLFLNKDQEDDYRMEHFLR